MAFLAGDTVFHIPSGEEWLLATDQDGFNVYPCGWPETIAKAEDCKLVIQATAEQRIDQLMKSSQISGIDVRRSTAIYQLGLEGIATPATENEERD